MSGYFSAIHGGTNQPIWPTLPFGPSMTAVGLADLTYFFSRSGWPQSSITTSTELPKPCQETSSLRFW